MFFPLFEIEETFNTKELKTSYFEWKNLTL